MGNGKGWDSEVNLDLDRIGNNYQVYIYFVIWIYFNFNYFRNYL